jgi:hypothetical protein
MLSYNKALPEHLPDFYITRYSAFVGSCYIEMRGKDGEIHSTTLDANRLFDAAARATHA